MNWMMILAIYLVLVNLYGFVIMGVDKRCAKKHAWRVPEKTLFIASIIGGSLGTLCGMYFFRHKTKHWYFVVGMPIIVVVHLVIIGIILKCYIY